MEMVRLEKLVNRIARENPQSKIALIGCQAQLQANALAQLSNVHWVVGNAEKMDLLSIIDNKETCRPLQKILPIPQKSFRLPYPGINKSLTRANLKIQDGCDFFCFFCVIPYARGRARSRDYPNLLHEANELASQGHKEIVLTGVNIGTYEFENVRFQDVVNGLLEISGLERVRISSIEPTTIPPRNMLRK